jgi:hypothetical protein
MTPPTYQLMSRNDGGTWVDDRDEGPLPLDALFLTYGKGRWTAERTAVSALTFTFVAGSPTAALVVGIGLAGIARVVVLVMPESPP